jgi:hypothetical protein
MFEPKSYGAAFAPLIDPERLNPLDAGSPDEAVRAAIDALSVDAAFAPYVVQDSSMARLCLAGLWFHHDCLDECHRISQAVATTSGNYWHALMHRREGDFWNSKYWFRQVGRHPIQPSLSRDAAALAQAAGPDRASEFLVTQGQWDAAAFVDLCEASLQGRVPHRMLCRRIQQREWQLLFDHCYRHAIGAEPNA